MADAARPALAGSDASRMHEVYDAWPRIAAEEYEKGREGGESAGGAADGARHVVFAGMGGSGAVGDTLAAVMSRTGVHVDVVKGYLLPRTAGPGSLVVATSVSGNTEETLSVLAAARGAGCRTVSFSDGGRMEEYCRGNGMPHVAVAGRHSPRASYAAFLYGMLGALGPSLPVREGDVRESISEMGRLAARIASRAPGGGANPAVELARWIAGPAVVYYPWGLRAAAVRLKNSLQENAKIHAMVEDVIEACHNGIVAWGAGAGGTHRPVMVRGADDHPKTKERWEILREFFGEEGIGYHTVYSPGGGILTKVAGLVYLFDYASMYRAALSGIDPTPVRAIDFVKERLARRALGSRQWAHGDLNPGSSPCKGDVMTDLDHEPGRAPRKNPFKL